MLEVIVEIELFLIKEDEEEKEQRRRKKIRLKWIPEW